MKGKKSKKSPRPTPGRVTQLYLDKGYSLSRLAKFYRTSAPTIRTILLESDVVLRSSREQNALNSLVGGVDYESRNREIEERYRNGATIDAIAETAGIGRARVAQILHSQGVTMRPRGVKATPEEVLEKMVVLYSEGEELSVIAKETGFAKQYVRAKIQESGIELRQEDWGTTPPRLAKLALRMYENGESISRASENTGVGEEIIRRHAKSAGTFQRFRGRKATERKLLQGKSAEISKLREDGLTHEEIGEQFQVSTPAIQEFIKKEGIHPHIMRIHKPSKVLRQNQTEVVRLRANGLSFQKIGNHFSVSRGAVRRFLSALKVPTNSVDNHPGPRENTGMDNIDNSHKEEGIPFRRFYLNRIKDETGISRTGRVLEAAVMQDGKVVTQWRPPHSTIGIYNSMKEFLTIHVDCHPSCNEVVWIDEESTA